MKRIFIERKCPHCQFVKVVRKDSAGILCQSCRAKANHKIRKIKDITGLKSGLLTVISSSHTKKNAYWNCICICGEKCVIQSNRLINQKTKSCGCITKTQKGLSSSPTYRNWRSMLQRCYDTEVEHYKRYGQKKITVCESWKKSYSNFLYDMGERPKGMTLDRIDPLGNYCLENCRWATNKQQQNNRSNNLYIEYNGKTQTLTQWAEEIGLKWCTLRKRIIDLKWPISKALTQKKRSKCH